MFCLIDSSQFVILGPYGGQIMKNSRLAILAGAAGLVTCQLLPAQASPITYNLVLQDTIVQAQTGSGSGTGSLTINGPVTATGIDTFTAGSGLVALSFTVDGNTFTLANALPGASVVFNNGNLASIAFVGLTSWAKLDLITAGLDYAYVDLFNSSFDSVGTITDPPAATPLPSTWIMMLTGLAGLGFLMSRKPRRGASPLPA
jgi:hypothetical protein